MRAPPSLRPIRIRELGVSRVTIGDVDCCLRSSMRSTKTDPAPADDEFALLQHSASRVAAPTWQRDRGSVRLRSRNRMPNFASQIRSGVLQHGLEHRLKLARRAGDDLEHLRGRGLLLQRFGRSSVRWRSSLSSRVFSIAITACAAKFCTSSICLSVNGRTSWRKIAIDADQLAFLEHRHAKQVRAPPSRLRDRRGSRSIGDRRRNIGDMNGLRSLHAA